MVWGWLTRFWKHEETESKKWIGLHLDNSTLDASRSKYQQLVCNWCNQLEYGQVGAANTAVTIEAIGHSSYLGGHEVAKSCPKVIRVLLKYLKQAAIRRDDELTITVLQSLAEVCQISMLNQQRLVEEKGLDFVFKIMEKNPKKKAIVQWCIYLLVTVVDEPTCFSVSLSLSPHAKPK